LAYLPFYITPEEFQEHQLEQETKIKSGDSLFEWEKFDIEEPNRYFNIMMSLVIMVPLLVFSYFIGFWEGGWSNIVPSILINLFLYSISYLSFGLDYHYTYTISSKGLVLKKRRNMPKWINKAVQIAAWCAAVFCILMVGVAGPMILAGAGGAILLAFGMLKKQPDEPIETTISFREQWISAAYYKKRKVIALYHKNDTCEYADIEQKNVTRYHSAGCSYLFFKSQTDLSAVIELITNHSDTDCVEVDSAKKIFGKDHVPDEFKKTPYRGKIYPVDEAISMRRSNTPIPELEYPTWYD
jgi:hypothetical protein